MTPNDWMHWIISGPVFRGHQLPLWMWIAHVIGYMIISLRINHSVRCFSFAEGLPFPCRNWQTPFFRKVKQRMPFMLWVLCWRLLPWLAAKKAASCFLPECTCYFVESKVFTPAQIRIVPIVTLKMGWPWEKFIFLMAEWPARNAVVQFTSFITTVAAAVFSSKGMF